MFLIERRRRDHKDATRVEAMQRGMGPVFFSYLVCILLRHWNVLPFWGCGAFGVRDLGTALVVISAPTEIPSALSIDDPRPLRLIKKMEVSCGRVLSPEEGGVIN